MLPIPQIFSNLSFFMQNLVSIPLALRNRPRILSFSIFSGVRSKPEFDPIHNRRHLVIINSTWVELRFESIRGVPKNCVAHLLRKKGTW